MEALLKSIVRMTFRAMKQKKRAQKKGKNWEVKPMQRF